MSDPITAPKLPKGYKFKVRHSLANLHDLVVELHAVGWFKDTYIASIYVHGPKVNPQGINAAMKEVWEANRFKIYVEAKIHGLEEYNTKLSEELAYERKVNDRVNEIFKGWFHHAG